MSYAILIFTSKLHDSPHQNKLIFCLVNTEKLNVLCILFYNYNKCAMCFFIFMKSEGTCTFILFLASLFLLDISSRFIYVAIRIKFFVSRSNVTNVWLTIYIHGVHSPFLVVVVGRGGRVEPPTKFLEREGLTGPQL